MVSASVKLTCGCRLKEKGRTFREAFLAKLGLLLRGTVAAPPERYGETLADEHIRGGTKSVSPAQTLCSAAALLEVAVMQQMLHQSSVF